MTGGHWLFPEDNLGRWKGLNNGDAEHFRKSPISSLAREIIQNSLDASDQDNEPVSVCFELLDISLDEFPDAENLLDKLNNALSNKNQDNRTKSALEKGVEVLSKPKIRVLKISEKNTKGMVGPYYDLSSPFYAYTKGSGLSQKGEGKIGSFGIGKKAPMTNSSLRTIFVSTKYQDLESDIQFLCQGISEWVSHEGHGGKIIDGAGFWGMGAKSDPINDESSIPTWLQRAGIGTNIYVCGFNADSGSWASILISSVLSSFFASIESGRLEVSAENFEVNKNTISGLFESVELATALQSLEDEDHLERFNLAKHFHQCLLQSTPPLSTQVQEPLGHFAIKTMVAEGLPRSVGFIRDGMFISANCIPSLRRFTNTLDFVAVVECKSEAGNKVLREMEPPEHNNFEGARYPGGQKLLNTLGKKLREQLSKVITPEMGNEATVNFMSDLFGIESESGVQNTNSPIDIDPNGKIKQTVKASVLKIPRVKSNDVDDFGDDENGIGVGSSDTIDPGGDKGSKVIPNQNGDSKSPNGDGENQLGKEAEVVNPRTIWQQDGGIETFITIPKQGDYLIRFEISGSEHDELLKVISTNCGRPFNDGVVISSTGEKERIQFKVKFEQSFQAAFVVSAYEI
jgi:hypothetical protein